jgi:hypothetical protein
MRCEGAFSTVRKEHDSDAHSEPGEEFAASFAELAHHHTDDEGFDGNITFFGCEGRAFDLMTIIPNETYASSSSGGRSAATTMDRLLAASDLQHRGEGRGHKCMWHRRSLRDDEAQNGKEGKVYAQACAGTWRWIGGALFRMVWWCLATM